MKLAIAFAVAVHLAAPAVADEPMTMRAAKRAETLIAFVKDFRLDLAYHGPQDKPFYHLRLTVGPVEAVGSNSFYRRVPISNEQATKIVDHLAKDGFFDRAHETDTLPKLPAGPLYLLRVQAGDVVYGENLGWDLNMLQRLDGLRDVLDGDAATSMDFLLGRLSGFRRLWEAEVKR